MVLEVFVCSEAYEQILNKAISKIPTKLEAYAITWHYENLGSPWQQIISQPKLSNPLMFHELQTLCSCTILLCYNIYMKCRV